MSGGSAGASSASSRAVEYFESLAPSYGQRRYGAGGGLWHRYFFGGRRRIALGWLAEAAGGVVADVGSGPGPLTGALAARGCRTIAVDGSAAMARAARAVGARAAVGDALALPLRDGVCDAAVALGLASYVDDLAALLRELARVVRPGGVVVVSVATSSAPDWLMRRALRRPAAALGVRGVLTSGVELRTRRRNEWRDAATAAGLLLEAEKGHDFTLFPLSRLLPGPAVLVGRAVEALDSRTLDALASEVVLRLRVPPAPAQRRRARRPRRIVRVIARLNVGGPALHAVLLTRGLEPGSRTVLACGDVGPGEAEATHLLERFDVTPQRIPGLGRKLSLRDDVRAFAALSALIRRERPDVVHTHTAKAGALGRVAAWLAGVPTIVHTFHGHVFHGYFGRLGSAAAVATERGLAWLSDRVLGVSDEVCADLVSRYRVASGERVRSVPIGLPLGPFVRAASERGALRRELRIGRDVPLAVMVGRIVPVKQPELALEVWRRVREQLPEAVLAIVGSGPLLKSLVARGEQGVRFLGWRTDTAPLVADADVALLTSRNEGTPVALIEAAAARVPAVATRVGGVPSVVEDGVTGLLAEDGDAVALAAATVALLRDPDRRAEMGRRAQERVLGVWSAERLIERVERLYGELDARVTRTD